MVRNHLISSLGQIKNQYLPFSGSQDFRSGRQEITFTTIQLPRIVVDRRINRRIRISMIMTPPIPISTPVIIITGKRGRLGCKGRRWMNCVCIFRPDNYRATAAGTGAVVRGSPT